jgi:alkanesulfonate monooxygenase SsuD/methylene tetrahydromethanopterin reductase-like flavin-dependent oxidoreductase (luciferase family)
MTISFSCRCPNADYLGFEASPDAIIQTAMKAEELGFDAVLVNDHIIVDGSPRAAAWTNTYDPFVALSFMAANTKRIGLGVSVLIVPYRNPIATAKALATLDRMSGGRLICGVGVGQVCERIGRVTPPKTRMSFRVEFSTVTGNAPPAGAERPPGWGTPAQVVDDLRRYAEAAGLDAFQINIHGNRDLAQLLDQMDCFVQEVRPHVT